ncbi:hypothetical protein [Streptomyces johnsoniae]|uniref:Uncharacterized protein n=1 Tax=Streptomyces johnsoniae TaxID=3075532 RepID=A0ABU2S018_9ACTN|nr:hypothetical protein [Streptomyces sp. DSM 41886]MDT0442356.1 hypothetical protein [Streptomyces sp. DSM 41886]
MLGDPVLGAFRKACHEAARRTPGVTFYELTEAAARVAFHSAAMSDRRLRHRILCRSRGGLVAFAAPPPFPGSAALDFREPPLWAEVFTWYGLRVLRTAVLTAPPSSAGPEVLDASDRQALLRWRPRTLGELVFTSWPVPGPPGGPAGRPVR